MPTNKSAGRHQEPHPGIEVDEAPLGSLLLQAVRAHAALATSLLAELGLAAPQEVVLLYLQDHGGVPQSELVRFLGRDRSTVTATLQTLERAALVERTPSQTDRRAMDVDLTEAGRALCPRIRAAWAELERLAFEYVAPRQRAELTSALGAVRDAARTHAAEKGAPS
ncbi:MarR family winged helix-turn-helix transcriptional regulator [Streptomonospora salina]|uniref:DNA-binding MarR family transcriptional regulator n=1 Tax=Streptomonospora salina TaxID=104205 RepID=A0A841ED39_9ACTN|nr:MarR family transcriptional regulator [Streptomonospora salina]MBB6000906.1 DNA-binding MarR family transcriptional regulator [Streptomonospora salina]